MNSKNVSFWLLLAGGVIVVSVAAWFIGNSVAGYVLKNRGGDTVQTGKTKPGLADKDSERTRNGEELTLGGRVDEYADLVEEEKTDNPDDDPEETTDDTAQETATEPIPSADSVTADAAAAAPADDSGDELFGGSAKPAGGTTDSTAAKPGDKASTKPSDKTSTKPAEKPAADTTAKKMLYRVQIGAFSSRENAAAYAEEAAEKTGLPASAIKDPSSAKGVYRVQCGAFSDKDRAQNLMRELELQGYQVHMSETPIE